MRAFTIACLLLAVSACKKFDGDAIILPSNNKPVWKPAADTIPDHAFFSLKLILDSTDYDETALFFDHKAKMAYDFNNDAAYLPGFGMVSIASISSDGRDMAIYKLPYSSRTSVGLDINSKKEGLLNLGINKQKNIPADVRIWLKDCYTNDSVDLRTGVYGFMVTKHDTNSFGSRRFRLILASGAR